MRRLTFILMAVTCLVACRQPLQARSAILLAHYGSSDDQTRSLTIDKITEDVKRAFPQMEVRESYISPAVRANLAKRGIASDSPVMAMLKLAAENFDTLYVQSTTLTDGVEMAEVRRAVEETEKFFSRVVTGRPLCFSPDDCAQVVEVLLQTPRSKDESVIYVGHGNMLASTATYSQLDYMMHVSGKDVYHVSTIEGYPTAQTTLDELRMQKGIKKVTLYPLLLVCGNHTKHDIAGEYSEIIRSGGYATQVVMRGLAELPAIRALYVNRLCELLTPNP